MKDKILTLLIISLFTSLSFADNENFDGQDVSGQNFSNKSLNNSSWIGTTAVGTNYSSSKLTSANFTNANLTSASFQWATLNGANFTNAIIKGVDFSKLYDYSVYYSDVISATQLYSTKSYKDKNLSGVNLSYNTLSNWDFSGQNLTNANFYNYQRLTDLTRANFTNANLTNVKFSSVTLTSANFRNADLRGANMKSTRGVYTTKNTIMADGKTQSFSMASSADNFSIRKYTPATEGGVTISAKFAENTSVSGDATLTLEQGAEVEVIDTAVLSFGAESTLAIYTDINGTSASSIGDNAGLTFEDGATVSVNLEGVFDSSLPYVFSILNWGDNSNVEGLLNLVKGDTLLLLINGVLFSGEWDYAITNNVLQISMNVPEPATYAAVFGALALGLAVARRRR